MIQTKKGISPPTSLLNIKPSLLTPASAVRSEVPFPLGQMIISGKEGDSGLLRWALLGLRCPEPGPASTLQTEDREGKDSFLSSLQQLPHLTPPSSWPQTEAQGFSHQFSRCSQGCQAHDLLPCTSGHRDVIHVGEMSPYGTDVTECCPLSSGWQGSCFLPSPWVKNTWALLACSHGLCTQAT